MVPKVFEPLKFNCINIGRLSYFDSQQQRNHDKGEAGIWTRPKVNFFEKVYTVKYEAIGSIETAKQADLSL